MVGKLDPGFSWDSGLVISVALPVGRCVGLPERHSLIGQCFWKRRLRRSAAAQPKPPSRPRLQPRHRSACEPGRLINKQTQLETNEISLNYLQLSSFLEVDHGYKDQLSVDTATHLYIIQSTLFLCIFRRKVIALPRTTMQQAIFNDTQSIRLSGYPLSPISIEMMKDAWICTARDSNNIKYTKSHGYCFFTLVPVTVNTCS